ncbi:FKBP-type peptidyl-prolyl cis-trans isomerase [Geomesophilobacter sediminis]|uniref:Peptidyl-prolyl cis-trans isomerase n=1 Tax=Geomesophilobacter sediminis TaxID=2798584 RepID=A0A8J7LWQ6_9BACT|nr:FKBP-type peptidyl-prolyl cis-trans isomerase [Geomesophilobacter sediminis]MBJ6726115.1 FKBP-type peptidyl-prolyl cis-trans isomerase [Geomesophilobacter sediminis]
MEAEEGKRVRISFICKLEDGTIYDIADADTLEFVVGQGNTLPTLEMGVLGMKPGDHRVIRVAASEAEEYPFDEDEAPTDSHFSAGARGPSFGYDFGPEDGGDVYLTMPAAPTRPLQVRRKVASDLYFDVEMISVEEAELELGE